MNDKYMMEMNCDSYFSVIEPTIAKLKNKLTYLLVRYDKNLPEIKNITLVLQLKYLNNKKNY